MRSWARTGGAARHFAMPADKTLASRQSPPRNKARLISAPTKGGMNARKPSSAGGKRTPQQVHSFNHIDPKQPGALPPGTAKARGMKSSCNPQRLPGGAKLEPPPEIAKAIFPHARGRRKPPIWIEFRRFSTCTQRRALAPCACSTRAKRGRAFRGDRPRARPERPCRQGLEAGLIDLQHILAGERDVRIRDIQLIGHGL